MWSRALILFPFPFERHAGYISPVAYFGIFRVSINISIYIYIYETNTTDTCKPTRGLATKPAHSHRHITRAVLCMAAAQDSCFALKGQSSFSVSLHSLRPSRGPMTHVFVRLLTSPTDIPDSDEVHFLIYWSFRFQIKWIRCKVVWRQVVLLHHVRMALKLTFCVKPFRRHL